MVCINPMENDIDFPGTVRNMEEAGRRFSARIQNKPKKLKSCPESSSVPQKKIKMEHKKSEKRNNEQSCLEADLESHTVSNGVGKEQVEKELGCADAKSAHARVTATIRTYNKNVLHFVQEEEKRCRKVIPKGNDTPEVDNQRKTQRPDLKAVNKMRKTNSILYTEKMFGPVPGVDVGHQFFSRAEMCAVGFHSHWLNGIDYMGQACKNKDLKKYTFPLAIAIVMSGQYEDDFDKWDDIVYTGQGGNDLLGNKRQVKDQVMQRGNLALKNSMDQCVPIRVVRGHNSKHSAVRKVYTYDGLYKVVKYWAEQGVSGFTVYKYRLNRLEGQPILTTGQVQFLRGSVPNSILDIRGLVCKDIAEGQEKLPIPVTNLVDDPPFAPIGFTYCKSNQVAKNVKIPRNASGCNCEGSCINPNKCACAKLNGADFPYVLADGGRLIEAKAIVFECGPKCGCGPDCVNRASQRVLKYRFEVFRTPNKGWAVRSWDFIPSGAPVSEYIGVLMKAEDFNSDDDSYLFDIDCLQTMHGLGGREKRLGDVSIPGSNHLEKTDDHKSESVPEFCIDASSTGNISRFINHSCDPNLFVQCVLSSHTDVKLARVVLFAADNILPMQELTYDYGYNVGTVTDRDGKIKQIPCYCGAADCRKRLL